jgi:hypothetical protein
LGRRAGTRSRAIRPRRGERTPGLAISPASSSGRSTRPSAISRSSTSARRSRGASGSGFLNREVVQLVLALAPDLGDVAKTAGRDEPGTCATTLDQRIREQGRRMHEAVEAGRVEVESGQIASMPSITARAGSPCVVSTLRLKDRPAIVVVDATSVKVPPMSMPRERAGAFIDSIVCGGCE